MAQGPRLPLRITLPPIHYIDVQNGVLTYQSLTPSALRALTRELAQLRSDPPEDVRVVVNEEDLSSLEGWVAGPAGTPYENGYFKVRFSFGMDYPSLPPKCTMITKIFHPNVSKAGEICVDTLKKGWKKEYGVGHVLVTIKCLLIYPNPESALDEEAGKQLLADYEGYCKYARLMTSIHATPKTAPIEFRNSTSLSSSATRPSPIPSSSLTSTSVSASASTSKTDLLESSCASPLLAGAGLTGSSARPAPLGQTLQQEQSPSVLPSPIFGPGQGQVGEDAMAKEKLAAVASGPVAGDKKLTGTKTGTGTGVKKTAVPAAKRGLKRL